MSSGQEGRRRPNTPREFICFAAGWSVLGLDDFEDAIMSIWTGLSNRARELRDLIIASPKDDALSQEGLVVAKQLIAFGDMLKCGGYLSSQTIAMLEENALADPTDPDNATVLALTRELDKDWGDGESN